MMASSKAVSLKIQIIMKIEDHSISATTTNQLAGRFAQLVMSDPTQISRLCASDSNSGSTSENGVLPEFFRETEFFSDGT